MSTKKDAPHESWESSFSWGHMRTAAREAAPQIASERLLQRGPRGMSVYKIVVKEEFNAIKYSFYERFSACHEELVIVNGFNAFLGKRRCKDWDDEISP